jgi:hypothetical protein
MLAHDPFDDWRALQKRQARREQVAWALIAIGILAILVTAATLILIWRG